MAKKKIGRFSRSEGGVSLARLNKIAEAVERLDSNFGGRKFGGPFNATVAEAPVSMAMVRLTEDVGPDESSEFRDRQGVLQYWDPVQYKWKDTYPETYVNIVSMAYGHFPVPRDTIVLCWYSRQAGKYVIINNPQVLHVRTVDPASGEYPTGAASKTYPIAFINTRYENRLDVTELEDSDFMESDVNRLTPAQPHGGKNTSGTPAQGEPDTTDEKYGYVYNLGTGYIPKDTDIHAWFVCGQLYTYYVGGGVIGRTQGEIAAMSGTDWPYKPGSGEVDVAEWNRFMELVDSGSDLLVYNTTRTTVQAGKIVQIKYVDGVPVIDVEDCDNNGV